MDNEQQKKFDDAIRAKLREVAVPVGLKTRILANARPVRSASLWTWLAPAAAVAITIAVVLLWPRSGNSFVAYRGEMIRYVSAKYELDLHSESLSELRENFTKNGYPSDYVVPPGLKNIAVEGGCLRRWHDHKVSLLCMEAKDHDVWLFVAENQAVPDAPPAAPVFAKTGKIATASWTAGGLIYILATEGDVAELKSYL